MEQSSQEHLEQRETVVTLEHLEEMELKEKV